MTTDYCKIKKIAFKNFKPVVLFKKCYLMDYPICHAEYKSQSVGYYFSGECDPMPEHMGT